MGQHDQAARYTVKLDPVGHVRWLVPALEPHLTFAGWLDTHTIPFPGEPDRTCDTVARFANALDPRRPLAMVLECQTKPHPDMLERLLEYVARVRREIRHGRGRRGKYDVAAAVINLTGPVQPHVLEMPIPGVPDAGLRLQVVQLTVREESAADFLTGIAEGRLSLCLLPWVPLMRGGDEAGIIAEWARLAREEQRDLLRADYGALARIFAKLARRRVAWRDVLGGWNVDKSPVIEEWLAAGEKRGELKKSRADLMVVLQRRCRGPIPADLSSAIESQTDVSELDRWFLAALDVNSFAEFRNAIRP